LLFATFQSIPFAFHSHVFHDGLLVITVLCCYPFSLPIFDVNPALFLFMLPYLPGSIAAHPWLDAIFMQ
jgi:hypothetical protein